MSEKNIGASLEWVSFAGGILLGILGNVVAQSITDTAKRFGYFDFYVMVSAILIFITCYLIAKKASYVPRTLKQHLSAALQYPAVSFAAASGLFIVGHFIVSNPPVSLAIIYCGFWVIAVIFFSGLWLVLSFLKVRPRNSTPRRSRHVDGRRR